MTARYDGLADGPTNMARDIALLDGLGHGWAARVYGWEGPWVSLGRFQRPAEALLPGAPVQWVVRPTGGKAVLHGHDVTVGLAASYSALGLPDGTRELRSVYRAVVRRLSWALTEAGLPASLAEDCRAQRTLARTADCFGVVSPNDVVSPITGQKVCGCALRLYGTAVLVQASIPVGTALVDPAKVFAVPSRTHGFAGDREALALSLAESLCWAPETERASTL